jgi:hypothetical protein
MMSTIVWDLHFLVQWILVESNNRLPGEEEQEYQRSHGPNLKGEGLVAGNVSEEDRRIASVTCTT